MKNYENVTREDLLLIIDNYRRNGQDTAEIETFLRDTFLATSKNKIPGVQQMVTELQQKSAVTEGACSICGAVGGLLSGVCQACFLPWATKVAKDNLIRIEVKKNSVSYNRTRDKIRRRFKMDKPQEKRYQVIDLAIERGWFINPSKGMELYIENVMRIGRCPCDPTRPDCPCRESIEEVTTKGHCKCGLYWQSYRDFRNTLRPLKAEEDEETTEQEF